MLNVQFKGELICIYLQICGLLQKCLPLILSRMPTEQPSRQSQEEEDCCQVCRQAYFTHFEKIHCRECGRIVHKFCYAPDLKDSKNFKCDECRRGKEGKCEICGKKNGILKSMGGHLWTHVLCGLTSSRIKVSSYRSLQFSFNQTPHKFTELKKCFICSTKTQDVFGCWQISCTRSAHVDCVLSYKFEQRQQSYLTFGMLDKHQYCLMNHLSHLSTKFKSWNFYPQIYRTKLVVCPEHNDDPHFIFCTCDNSKLKNAHKDSEVTQVCCNNCKRWFHQQCSGVKDLQKDFDCIGCKQNNFFKKSVQFPQLIEKIGDIELKTQFDKQIVRLLDSFIFNLSQSLIDLCLKNSQEINRFYLRRTLEKYARDDIQNSKKQRIAKSSGRIMEIIYLYVKDTLKQSSEITAEDITVLLNQMTNPRSVFSGMPAEYLKLYTRMLEQKLSGFTKYDINDIRNSIARFVDKNKQSLRSLSDLGKEVRQIVKLMDKNESMKQYFSQQKDCYNLFDFFYRSKLAEQQYLQILDNFVRINSLKRGGTISLTQYTTIITFSCKYSSLNQNKRKQLAAIYQNHLRDFKIKKQCEQKADCLEQLNNKLKNKSIHYDGIVKARQKLIGRGIFLSSTSPLIEHETKEMQYEIRKKKLLKIIKNPPLSEMESIITEIKQILLVNNDMLNLSESDKSQMIRFQSKFSFFLKLVSYYANLKNSDPMPFQEKPKNAADRDRINKQVGLLAKMQITSPKRSLSEMATDAMLNWDKSQQSIDFGFDLLHQAALSRTEFQGSQKEIVCSFAEGILDTITVNYINNTNKLKPKLLKKACRVIAFIKYEEYYPKLMQWQTEFNQWKRELEDYANYEAVLQNQYQISNFLQVIQTKLITAEAISLDISSQITKLKILRIWCSVSLKLIAESKQSQKYTINAIQLYKSCLQKLNYPSNRLKKQIDSWDNEYTILNKKVNKFLDKGKIADLQVHEQLRIMSQKMTVQQAEQLRAQLEGSALNFQAELVELNAQIQSYRNLPTDLKRYADAQQKSANLIDMRKTISENSLRYEPLEDYYYLIQRIEHLKCLQFKGQTSYKEYMRMLSLGGTAAVSLLAKTTSLYSAYRQIDKAKRQFINRGKTQYLLPLDNRKLKLDLKEDPSESQTIQRYYLNLQIQKEKYAALKLFKNDYDKYQQIIYELQRLPINCSSLINEILKLKKQTDELSEKAQKYLNESVSFESAICLEIVNRYKTINIKTDTLEKFDDVVHRWKQVTQIAKTLKPQNYKSLSLTCQKSAELNKHPEIVRLREDCFRKMYKLYLDANLPLMELGQTLMDEGCFLCRFIQKSTEILPMLMQINSKIFRTHSKLINFESDISSLSPNQIVQNASIGSVESEGEYDLDVQKGSDLQAQSLIEEKSQQEQSLLDIDDIAQIDGINEN